MFTGSWLLQAIRRAILPKNPFTATTSKSEEFLVAAGALYPHPSGVHSYSLLERPPSPWIRAFTSTSDYLYIVLQSSSMRPLRNVLACRHFSANTPWALIQRSRNRLAPPCLIRLNGRVVAPRAGSGAGSASGPKVAVIDRFTRPRSGQCQLTTHQHPGDTDSSPQALR